VDPSFAPAHFRLGRVLVWRAYQANLSYAGDEVGERNAEARRLAEEASREIEAARKEAAGFDSRIQSDVAAAMTAYLAKEMEKVIEASQAAIARHAGQRGVEEFWWLLCLANKVRAEKLRCIEQAIALRPKFPLALFHRAVLHADLGHLDLALQDYDRVIELCPTFAEAYVNRGSVRFRAKDAKGSIEDFDSLIRMGRRLGAAYNGRGRARFELQGDLEGGLADLTEAIRLMPNHYLPRQSRAVLYLKMGEYDKCIADTMASIDLRGDLPSILTRFRARVLKGDAPGALEDGRVFLQQAPKDHAAVAEVQKAVDELARKLQK
jgi:tetratricopeptide (TPR) repeat protein